MWDIEVCGKARAPAELLWGVVFGVDAWVDPGALGLAAGSPLQPVVEAGGEVAIQWVPVTR
jgi:hypothetical protein